MINLIKDLHIFAICQILLYENRFIVFAILLHQLSLNFLNNSLIAVKKHADYILHASTVLHSILVHSPVCVLVHCSVSSCNKCTSAVFEL